MTSLLGRCATPGVALSAGGTVFRDGFGCRGLGPPQPLVRREAVRRSGEATSAALAASMFACAGGGEIIAWGMCLGLSACLWVLGVWG